MGFNILLLNVMNEISKFIISLTYVKIIHYFRYFQFYVLSHSSGHNLSFVNISVSKSLGEELQD